VAIAAAGGLAACLSTPADGTLLCDPTGSPACPSGLSCVRYPDGTTRCAGAAPPGSTAGSSGTSGPGSTTGSAASGTSGGEGSSTGAAAGTSTGATAGASTGATTGGGSTGGADAGNACADYASAFCALYQACSNGFFIAQNYGTLAACESAFEAQCLARLAVPRADLNTTKVALCAQEVPLESCVDLYSGAQAAACEPAPGTLGDGSSCALDAQCATAFCAQSTGEICGTCQTKPAAGADCSTTQCAPGYVCLAASKTCALPGGDGGSCSAESDCQFGFGCVGTSEDAGFCAPSGVAGQSCNDKLGPRGCDGRSGLACRAGDGGSVCAPVPFADAGQPCGAVPGASGTACRDATCFRPLDGGKEGVCLAAAADGAPCNDLTGPSCHPFSRCVAGTCTAQYSSTCGE